MEHQPLHAVPSDDRSDSIEETARDPMEEKQAIGLTRMWTIARTRTAASLFSAARTTSHVLQDHQASRDLLNRIWTAIKDYPFKKKQAWAILLLTLAGITPFAVWIKIAIQSLDGAFGSKTIPCGDSFGSPQNSTVKGAEAIFVLNWSFGRFTFSQVKTIDVVWDLVVGRGAQMILWVASYRIFTNALLRLIERHPAVYTTFMSISLEGASLDTSLALLRELIRTRSKRTWFLFLSLLLSSLYVLSVPSLFGAMTGYDSRTIAWVSVGDPDNIVPSSMVHQSYFAKGTWNESFTEPTCAANFDKLIADWIENLRDMRQFCDCQSPNGTRMPFQQYLKQISQTSYDDTYVYSYDSYSKATYSYNSYAYSKATEECHFNFTGNDKIYTDAESNQHNCNDTHPYTFKNKTYSMFDIDYGWGFCYLDKGYNDTNIRDSTRCLPDTAHPSYQWGFSSSLLGIVMILNFVWCITMWIIWQDTLLATLVRSGYEMSRIKAAFILTEAAQRRTGMNVEELIVRQVKTLQKELGSAKGESTAVVEKTVFRRGWEPFDVKSESQIKLRRLDIANADEDSAW